MTSEIDPDPLVGEVEPGSQGPTRTLLADGARLGLLRVSQYGVFFAVGIVSSRALGPELRGQFALAASLGGVTFAVFHLSLQDAAGRLVANKAIGFHGAMRVLLIAGGVLGLLGGGVAFAVGAIFRNSLLNGIPLSLVVLGALLVPVSILQQYGGGLLVRLGSLRAYGWISLLAAVTQLVLVVLFTITGLSPALALVASIAGTAFGSIGLWRATRRDLRKETRDGGTGSVAGLVGVGIRLHGASLALALMLGLDVLLVGAFEDDTAVGLYSLAAALANLVFLGVNVVAQAALHRQTVEREETAAEFTADVVRISWIASIVVAGALALVSYPLVVLVYGEPFTGSVPPLAILAIAAVAFGIEGPLRNFLYRARGPHVVSLIAIGGLILNVALNLILIPAMGIAGAALASALAYWAYAIVLLFRFRSVTGISFSDTLIPRVADLRAIAPTRAVRL